MELSGYIKPSPKSLNDFLSLDENQALKFDFLTQGINAEKTELANSIYQKIFPWFNEKDCTGNKLFTYQEAVKKYYGSEYEDLDRKTQLEITDIIKKHTLFDEDQIFEFTDTDENENNRYHLCDNNQIGNLWILPVKGEIGLKRAQKPYCNFIDQFLHVLADFYLGNLEPDDELKEAISNQRDYFYYFNNLDNFCNLNYLFSLFDDNLQNTKKLTERSTFEKYVSLATSFIKKRGQKIIAALRNDNSEEKVINFPENSLYQKIAKNSKTLEEHYPIDQETALQTAQLMEYLEVIINQGKITDRYQKKVDTLTFDVNSQIQEEESRQLVKKFAWTRWWHWLLLYFIVLPLLEHLFPTLLYVRPLLKFVFWGALIAKTVYDIYFSRKKTNLVNEQQKKIANLEKEEGRNAIQIEKNYEKEIDVYRNKYQDELLFINLVPVSFRNDEDVAHLVDIILEKRAINYQQAYALLEEYKHRQKLEEEARRSADAAEAAAAYERQTAEAVETNVQKLEAELEKQTRKLEDLKWEVKKDTGKIRTDLWWLK